ncbi:MAG: hypothetical protein ACRD2I_01755 [Vicinamibacterales bacterium]
MRNLRVTATPARQLATCLARFSPEITALAKRARARLRQRLPRAIEMVYDNYNALVIGYSPTERPSDAIVSLVIFPKRVSVCFIQGRHLPDPHHVLKGDGNQVRFMRLDERAAVLDTAPVHALVSEAIAFGEVPFTGRRQLVIRAIAKKQRPRR